MTSQRNSSILPAVLLATLVGGGAGYFAGDLSSAPDQAPIPANDEMIQDIEEISVLLDDLVADRALGAKPEPMSAPAVLPASHTSQREPVHDTVQIEQLSSRVMELERVVGAWQQERESATANEQQANARRVAERALRAAQKKEDAVQAAQSILDGAKSDTQKLESWSTLRGQEEAYTDAIVQEMIRIGTSATDAAHRADVWRQADGRSKHPALAHALVLALQTDPEAKVREEAAETLEIYRDVPGVVEALRIARDGDAAAGVRRQASNSLGG